MATMTFKADLVPNTDMGNSLGTSTQQWNIYGYNSLVNGTVINDNPSDTDLNNYINPGNYYTESSIASAKMTNTPPDGLTTSFILKVYKGATASVYTSLEFLRISSSVIWRRRYNSSSGGSWSNWITSVLKSGDTMSGDLNIQKTEPSLTLKSSTTLTSTTGTTITPRLTLTFKDLGNYNQGLWSAGYYATSNGAYVDEGKWLIRRAAGGSIYVGDALIDAAHSMTSTAWIAAWDGWTLGYINPDDLTTTLDAVKKSGDHMSGNLYIDRNSPALTLHTPDIKDINGADTNPRMTLTISNGSLGLWSSGYYVTTNVTTPYFVNSDRWLIYRRPNTGEVTFGKEAWAGYKDYTLMSSLGANSLRGEIYLYSNGGDGGKRGIWLTNSNGTGNGLLVIDDNNEITTQAVFNTNLRIRGEYSRTTQNTVNKYSYIYFYDNNTTTATIMSAIASEKLKNSDDHQLTFYVCLPDTNNTEWGSYKAMSYIYPKSGDPHLDVEGYVQAKDLIITDTSATARIQFSRSGTNAPNYILFPIQSRLNFVGNDTRNTNNSMMILESATAAPAIIPGVTNWVDLGKSNLRWKNIYGTNIYSTDINGTNITGNFKGNLALPSKGILTTTGSSLNTYVEPGVYYSLNSTLTNTLTEKPLTGAGFKMLVLGGYGTDVMHLIVFGLGNNWMYRYTNSISATASLINDKGWSKWNKMVTIASTTDGYSDASWSAVGSTSLPIYVNSAGVVKPVTAVGIAYGGTGATDAASALNTDYLLSGINSGNLTADLGDNTIILTSSTNGFTTTYKGLYLRKFSKVYDYILNKLCNDTTKLEMKRSIWSKKSGDEALIIADSDAGRIYFYASGSTTGSVGIYTFNANQASGKIVLNIPLDLSLMTTEMEFQAPKVWGAVYNDYAEMRNVPEAKNEDNPLKPGTCVREVGDGTMVATTERLQRGCKIISDTFGFNIGKTEDCRTPIAVSGRALVYLDQDREIAKDYIGWPVCSGPNGTVSIMTEEEEEKYPSRIVGTISEIPDYEKWGSSDVEVNGRIWIYVR